jgi:integrase
MQYKLQPPGKRGPCWYIRWTQDGRDRERSTGAETRRGAETFAERYFGELARRRVPGAGETVGFRRAAEAYKAFAHLSTLDERLVDALVDHFHDVDDCRTLTHAHLVGAANALLKPGCADSTKNRKVITPGAAVLHYAASQKWCEYQRIRKFWVSRVSNRAPATDDTMAALMAHIEDPLEELAPQWNGVDPNLAHKRLLLAMLYEMGLRLGAYLRIDWTQIDLPACTVAVRVPKSDKMATIGFSPVIAAMMANLPSREGRLFPWSTNSGVYAWLKRVCKRAKVRYSPHLSRHALATAADAAQIPDKRAAELGVWSDPRSLHRYQHVRPEAIPGRTAAFLTAPSKKKSA